MLMFIQNIGLPEIVMILGLALLIFGPKKIPELGRSLGKGLREFKKGTSGLMESFNEEVRAPAPTPEPTRTLEAPKAESKPEPKAEDADLVIDLEKEGKNQ